MITAEERCRLDECARDPEGFAAREREDEEERRESRRLWSAVMLASNLDVCRSCLSRQPVLARQLDGQALRRALRGRPLPRPETYIVVDADMLDAVAEGGAFTPRARRP